MVLCHLTDLQYSAEKCQVCHGDISLNNIVINRIWDDEYENCGIDDGMDGEGTNTSNNMAPDIDMDGTSDIAGPGKVHTTDSELIPAPATLGASDPRPVPIKAHGLVIDNDCSFSLVEVAESGDFVNPVRYSTSIHTHTTSNYLLGNTTIYGS